MLNKIPSSTIKTLTNFIKKPNTKKAVGVVAFIGATGATVKAAENSINSIQKLSPEELRYRSNCVTIALCGYKE